MEKLKQKIQESVKLYKSGDFIKCEKNTKKLINLSPKVAFLYNLLGLALNAQNKIDEAIQSYNEGLKIDSNYAMIYNNLGLIYYKKSSKGKSFKADITKAENLYKKSIYIFRLLSR